MDTTYDSGAICVSALFLLLNEVTPKYLRMYFLAFAYKPKLILVHKKLRNSMMNSDIGNHVASTNLFVNIHYFT